MRTILLTPILLLLASTSVLANQVDEKPVVVSVALVDDSPLPAGSEAMVEVVAEITEQPDGKGKRWHIYPRKEQHQGVEVPTAIKVVPGSSHLKVGEVQWPKTRMAMNAMGEYQPVYEGTVAFRIPIQIASDTPVGEYPLSISFSYQTCASLCLAPTTEKFSITVRVDSSIPSLPQPDSPIRPSDAVNPPSLDQGDLNTKNSANFENTSTSEKSTIQPRSNDDFETNVFGFRFGFANNSPFAWPLIILFAIVGGFLLNLTPCVLPLIPIKILGITHSASGGHRSKVLGISMGLGILAFWLAIGLAISFVSGFDSISSLFQRPWFGISVGTFIALMGIGMMVDMSIQLPQAVYRINPRHDTLHGAFLFGVMTAVLSTPCTAPFMGSAAAWATKANNPVLVLVVFAAIAIGMGWPYVLLSWYPKFLSWVPRTGPASVLVKQVMGLLMVAVAVFFAGTGVLGLVKEYPHLGPVLHWWIATIIVAVMAIWMILQTMQITYSPAKRLFFSAIALSLFAGMVIWSKGETFDSWEATEMNRTEQEQMKAYVDALERTVREGSADSTVKLRSPSWRNYDPEAYARAKRNGQIAIVHFTADW